MPKPSGYKRNFDFKESNFGSTGYPHKVTVSGDLEINSQNLKGQRFTVMYGQLSASDVAKTFFIATAPCKFIQAYERHVTVAGQAGTLTIEKLNTGEAPGAGDVLLASAWDLTSTANTPVLKAGVTTGVESMVAGDTLCLKVASGSATSYALGSIVCELEWL